MGGEIKEQPITALFREAAQKGTIEHWFQGLNILADVVSRMENSHERPAWNKVGKTFREAVINGEIVIVGDFGFLAERGRELAFETSMSAYPEISEKDGVVLFVLNRRALDLTLSENEVLRNEAYSVVHAVRRLRNIKRNPDLELVKADDVDESKLAVIRLSCVLNDLFVDEIRQFDMLD